MPETPPPRPDSANDIDVGEPVAELAELRQTPTSGFLTRIRRRLQRRFLAADASEFSWFGLSFVAVEFVKLLFQFFQSNTRSEGDQ